MQTDPPLQAIAPIVKAADKGWEIIGTGFFVTTCGTLFTAGHVAKEWEEGSDLAVIHQEFDGTGYIVRHAIQAIVHPSADVAVLRLDSFVSEATGKLIRNGILEVSVQVPLVNSRVACWGFPQSHLMPPNDQFDGWAIALERQGATGVIREHFPNGRDRVMQPGACFETSMNTMGGASGGPVFDEHGRVFAVVSTGFDEHTTYVASVRDLALARMFRAEPPGGDGSIVNLLEYIQRY